MRYYLNAKDWANHNLNQFMTTPLTPWFNGQCVSLAKRFLQQQGIKNWQKARGNAKDFGDTLVKEGKATQIPFSNRLRGDIIVWKQDGGGYGHIGVLVSQSEVFEQNVGLAGTKTANFGLGTVYASRIDRVDATWRKGKPTVYRLKAYKEYKAFTLITKSNFRKKPTILSRKTRTKNKGYTVHVLKFVTGYPLFGSNKWALVRNKDYIKKELIRRK